MTIEHSVYAPSETVEVVITNNLDTPIYTRTASNCLTLDVRRIVHDEWQFLPTCWRIIEAPPGVHYNVVLAHSLGGDEVSPTGPAGALSDGTYRVGFAYSTHKPDPDPRTFLQAPVYVWSPTFQVCTCRSC